MKSIRTSLFLISSNKSISQKRFFSDKNKEIGFERNEINESCSNNVSFGWLYFVPVS